VNFCVDDQEPSFSSVDIHGNADIFHYKPKEVLKWAIKIANDIREKSLGLKN
jgi:hypothetical protein